MVADGALRRVLQRMERAVPEAVVARADRHLADIEENLHLLYGHLADFTSILERILGAAIEGAVERPVALDDVDASGPTGWSHTSMGATCYVDRFAGSFDGLRGRLDYLEELGVDYLHLMPPYRTPRGGGDGGYAVSTYRQTDPALGGIDDLRDLATECRRRGIRLALDVVCNHTADDHPWAVAAASGDAAHRDFYFIYPDRRMPDTWEQHLREVFPTVRRGSFTLVEGVGWVWTTFHSNQWDLNYANPAVFEAMFVEMVFLAGLGADVLRLDAVPFLWKRAGTASENLPEVHALLRAWRSLMRIAAPAVTFKSEAIVHPDDVRSYLGPDQCELSYNPVLMVGLWDALATGDTSVLRETMRRRIAAPEGTAWLNYVRSHDDIGWGFADEDAAAVGLDGFEHRLWLNEFFTGAVAGSWARGLPFQFNPETRDMRISGTTASLCGLETASELDDPVEIDLAVRRILLLLAATYAVGGIPLLYLGDEIGMLNDYSFREVPERAEDSRWAHRPQFDWDLASERFDATTPAGRIHTGLVRLVALRRRRPAFGAGSTTRVIDAGNRAVLAYEQAGHGDRVVVAANFTAQAVEIGPGLITESGLVDVIGESECDQDGALVLGPYQMAWLVAGG